MDQVCSDVGSAEQVAHGLGATFDRAVDSIYLGGGTPSVLAPEQLRRMFAAVRQEFQIDPAAEITVECAPGTLSDEVLAALLDCGVNRVSLGVQSFVDKESSSVGRLHTREITLQDVARLREAGIGNISLDLIAGLPYQTAESWEFSLAEALATGVPHVSVYMLEVDEDSRLGTELLAGGTRYHAHHVPDDDLTADLYLAACERLERGGVHQYEISNFAREVTHGIGLRDSRHNLKYWTRQPYLGFGVDAHSMLPADAAMIDRGVSAVRFATPDALEKYQQQLPVVETQLSVVRCPLSVDGADSRVAARVRQLASSRTLVDSQAALEEEFFLGLRLNRGVAPTELRHRYGEAVDGYEPVIAELVGSGLLERTGDRVRLTARGRLLSNEVFVRFLKDGDRATHLQASS